MSVMLLYLTPSHVTDTCNAPWIFSRPCLICLPARKWNWDDPVTKHPSQLPSAIIKCLVNISQFACVGIVVWHYETEGWPVMEPLRSVRIKNWNVTTFILFNFLQINWLYCQTINLTDLLRVGSAELQKDFSILLFQNWQKKTTYTHCYSSVGNELGSVRVL